MLAEGSEWFAPVVSAEFDNPHTRTADALVGSIATTSQMLVTAEPEREERLGAIRAYLAARPETSAGGVHAAAGHRGGAGAAAVNRGAVGVRRVPAAA